MKKSHRCPRCHSNRVGYLEEVKDSSVDRLVVGTTAATLFVKKIGALEAYLCADCGFYQTYVKEPRSISYEEIEGFHWLNPEQSRQGPYR